MAARLKEFQVVGRMLPTDKVEEPKLYRMRLFAPNEIVAKSRFWYFLKFSSHFKKTSGEIVSVNQIFEKKPGNVKNYGIWLRYNSRSGTHNMYKEYRDVTRVGAVTSMYQDMASKHRARFASIQVIRVAEVKSADVRRANIKQILDPKLKFPLPHIIKRAPSRRFRTVLSANRPRTC